MNEVKNGGDSQNKLETPAQASQNFKSVWSKRLSIAICVLSALALINVFASPWTYKKDDTTAVSATQSPSAEYDEKALLSLAKQQPRLIVGKVYLNAVGWHSRKEKKWTGTSEFVRGWAVPCSIDVYIDMGKLNDGSLRIQSTEDGQKSLTLILPMPEIDERQANAIKPNKLKLVLEHGKLESGEFTTFRQKAFSQIQGNIEQTLNENADTIMEMSKNAAVSHFASFFAALGIPRLTVQWAKADDLSASGIDNPPIEEGIPL